MVLHDPLQIGRSSGSWRRQPRSLSPLASTASSQMKSKPISSDDEAAAATPPRQGRRDGRRVHVTDGVAAQAVALQSWSGATIPAALSQHRRPKQMPHEGGANVPTAQLSSSHQQSESQWRPIAVKEEGPPTPLCQQSRSQWCPIAMKEEPPRLLPRWWRRQLVLHSDNSQAARREQRNAQRPASFARSNRPRS